MSVKKDLNKVQSSKTKATVRHINQRSTIIDSASVVESDTTVDYFYGSDSGCIDHGFYGIYGDES
jgi:hypothetical protein